MNLDALVTRLYRAAVSITDTGWQELLKNAAFSLSGMFLPRKTLFRKNSHRPEDFSVRRLLFKSSG